MFTQQEKLDIKKNYDEVLARLKDKHIGCFRGYSAPVFFISDTYPGIWLEHAYDALFFAKMEPEYLPVAKNTLMLFIDKQKDSGQLPCFVINPAKNDGGFPPVGYSQTQECVSFARLCYEYWELSGDDEFLVLAFDACEKWVRWQEEKRMTLGTGLMEMFCGYDTGHDNSGRLEGLLYQHSCKDADAENYPEGDPYLPILAPDMNAVFYGSLSALAAMAKALGRKEEEELYAKKAEKVKEKLFRLCYDPDDAFFYDVDRLGNKRKYLSISITNLYCEKVLDKDVAEEIYQKHLKNEDEFWTPFPFPAMAKSDKSFRQNLPGNSWGFYSQGLTILRLTRWMDHYGKGADFDLILEKWLRQWTYSETVRFGQELHPIEGTPSECSAWYSSCMLLYLYGVRRLHILD